MTFKDVGETTGRNRTETFDWDPQHCRNATISQFSDSQVPSWLRNNNNECGGGVGEGQFDAGGGGEVLYLGLLNVG